MKFEQSIIVRASPADIFALTQDYARRLEWDPFLKSATLLGGATAAGLGVRACCVARSGLAMETEYVSFNPPQTCAIKMTAGPKLIDSFAGSWSFDDMGDGRTKVTFRYFLKARPRWFAWAMTPLAGWAFGRDTGKRLVALKQAFERE